MNWIIGIISFVAGAAASAFLSQRHWNTQEWMVMKWCKTSLGFRPVMIGSRLYRGDNVVMALKVDDTAFSENGEVVE